MNMPVESNNHMGQKFQRLRMMAGVKQDYVANFLRISQQRISQLEKKENISPEILRLLAASIGVTPEFLVNFKPEIQTDEQIHYAHFETNPMDKMIHLFDEQISWLKKRANNAEKEVLRLKKKLAAAGNK